MNINKISKSSPLARGVAGGTRRGATKKFIIAIMCVLGIATAYAETNEITTSQYYVDTNAATKQDAVPANNANTVMTYDSTADSGIGTKAIYNESSTYETQKNALVSAATANAAIQNGINSEFTCANPPKCNLWNMAGLFPTTMPAGYTELEYIESTGTQYINTGVAPDNETGLMVKFNKSVSGDQVVVGIDTGGTTSQMYVNPAGRILLPFGERYIDGDTGITTATNFDYEIMMNYMNNRKRYVNGDSVLDINNTLTANASTNTMYLFAGNYNGRYARTFFKGRVYYLKISEGQTLVRDMIPARRNSDNVLGMYDLVTNTFFTNQGGGNFVAGPVASFIPQNQ